MKYVSIDIETTGLDPNTDQVLSLAAVYDDTERAFVPVDQLPNFSATIQHHRLSGAPIALAMNARLIQAISENQGLPPSTAIEQFKQWLHGYFPMGRRIVVAGKNVGTFDLPFLFTLDGTLRGTFHRRVLDPAAMFVNPTDTEPPALKQCANRAGVPAWEEHDALGDARAVVSTLRAGWAFGAGWANAN